MIKVILFDLDDTLISELDFIKSGYKHVSEFVNQKYGINSSFNDFMKLFYEDSKNVFNRLLDQFFITYTKEDILELVNEYRNHLPEIKFFDDVIPTIKALNEKNIKLGIISDGYLSTQRNKEKVLNLNAYFQKVIFTEELGRKFWKPHPKAFELMKEYFNVEYDEMIYIGDNPEKDFYISSIYPIKTVRIKRDNTIYKDRYYYSEVRESYQIRSLSELVTIINI